MNDFSKVKQIKDKITVLLIEAGRTQNKELIDALESINNILIK